VFGGKKKQTDLIEVFKMSQGKSIIGFQDLFILEKNSKSTRDHLLKLTKVRCTRDCWLIDGTSWTRR